LSRGGTKRARAEQERRRRIRDRAASADATRKDKREPKPKQGRGKAVALHLMSLLAPLVMAAGLLVSGQWTVNEGEDPPGYVEAVADFQAQLGFSNDPYWQDPVGFGYMLVVWSLAAAVFWLLMVVGWRRIYRNVPFLDRDWSSVDQSFTLLVVIAVAWLARGLFGYTLTMESLVSMVFLLALYVPLFSAGLALVLPVVPGSGRVGGVLPSFLKIPFTRRFLMDEVQREDAAVAQVTIKAATAAAREADEEARRAKREAKKAAKQK